MHVASKAWVLAHASMGMHHGIVCVHGQAYTNMSLFALVFPELCFLEDVSLSSSNSSSSCRLHVSLVRETLDVFVMVMVMCMFASPVEQ